MGNANCFTGNGVLKSIKKQAKNAAKDFVNQVKDETVKTVNDSINKGARVVKKRIFRKFNRTLGEEENEIDYCDGKKVLNRKVIQRRKVLQPRALLDTAKNYTKDNTKEAEPEIEEDEIEEIEEELELEEELEDEEEVEDKKIDEKIEDEPHKEVLKGLAVTETNAIVKGKNEITENEQKVEKKQNINNEKVQKKGEKKLENKENVK